MRRRKPGAVLAVAVLALIGAAVAESGARAQDGCLSWSQARNAGWIEKYNLRPANRIKAGVERRHNGRVVKFVLCPRGDSVVYRLSVLRTDGNVVTVTEPAQ